MTDAERLAALLDGRLGATEREAAIARLAASDEEVEAYADAAAVLRELEEEDAGVTPLRAPSRRAPARRWLALAAVLACVALAPWLWTRAAADRTDPARFAAELSGLPAGWDASPWGATRGAGDPLTPQARAVRLGARLVELELAVRGRDPAVRPLAAETAALLDGIPAAGPAAALYRELARRAGEEPARLEPLLEQGRGVVPRLAGEEPVELGAWTEAARIAAAGGAGDFFASRATRSRMERMARDPSLPPAARSTMERVGTAVASPAPEWPAVERELAGVLRSLGG